MKNVKHILLIFIFYLLFYQISFCRNLIYVLDVKGVIDPIVVGYIKKGISISEDRNAHLLIIKLNTPGGLADSMREIVEEMLNSKLPIVVYVAPAGARAASAGLFISVAADYLVMSPGTNIGAAHPVAIGGEMSKEMKEKVTHDAAAYIRSTARKGRNIKWIEKAVRESVSITAEEAVKKKVADFTASTLQDLLKKLDGKKVDRVKVKISTKDVEIRYINMNFIENFLHALVNPNIAYVLMLIAIYGIIYEFMSPGAILPGVIGVIALILAFFSFGSLPINYAALALIGFSIILFIAEIKVPSFGILGVGGIISFILGSLMLFVSHPEAPYLAVRVSLSVLLPSAIITIGFFLVATHFVIKALKMKVVSGVEALIGKAGVVKTDLDPTGIVLVEGEDWNATSINGKIKKGKEIEVIAIDGLMLKVKKKE